ncbi:MAG: Na/Pi cotransporter family protein [Erysipelotrichaceae bacterium]|nr:Na/Pi cotransporter family protein [Erysipelotrichaceae bacterium]
MSTTQILENLLKLSAGIGIYLIAFKIISSNLEAVSSEGLKKVFARISESRLIGILLGAFATVLIQSSSAVTVMTIGFVNAGIMSLRQAATIIFGSEIGTTISGQIVALGLFDSDFVSLNTIFSSFAGLGIVISSIAKSDIGKKTGQIISGFGMLFCGLGMMSSSMSSFAQLEELRLFLASFRSGILLIVAGALITAIIHSSAAMTSIAITMVASGLISLEQGIYITLGANIGTCFTGLMAAMSSNTNSKRTSVIQLIFNTGGAVIVYVLDTIAKSVSGGTMSAGILFSHLFSAPHVQLAMFHTIFNIASVLVVIPLTDYLVNLSIKLVPQQDETVETERFYYVDENMLKSPSLAVFQVMKEIVNMAAIAMKNFNTSITMITKQDFTTLEEFRANEKELNFLNQKLVEYVVKLSATSGLSRKDHRFLSSTHRAIADIERIGDYSENITEYAENLKKEDVALSESALQEVSAITEVVNKLYEKTMDSYENNSKVSFMTALKLEDEIDELSRQMAQNHISRLNKGLCSAEAGAQFIKLANDIERIGDHLVNIIDREYKTSH